MTFLGITESFIVKCNCRLSNKNHLASKQDHNFWREKKYTTENIVRGYGSTMVKVTGLQHDRQK